MELEELAEKIIKLEEKLADPNEESYTIETQYPLKVKKILEGIGYLSKHSPNKMFLQVYLPEDNSVSGLETRFYLEKFYSVKISRLQPGRVRQFDRNEARKAFQMFYMNRFNFKEDDFIQAKKLAIDAEYKSGKNFPRSAAFSFQKDLKRKKAR